MAKTAKKPSRICTAENICPDENGWIHPATVKVYEGALYDTFECPHCGQSWKAAKQ